MDLQQEQLASLVKRSPGHSWGHAGSGKNTHLAYRCQYLARAVQTYLGAVLQRGSSLLSQADDTKATTWKLPLRFVHFHGWCMDQLEPTMVIPNRRQYDSEAYVEAVVNRVIRRQTGGGFPLGEYGTVMIDEA